MRETLDPNWVRTNLESIGLIFLGLFAGLFCWGSLYLTITAPTIEQTIRTHIGKIYCIPKASPPLCVRMIPTGFKPNKEEIKP